MRNAQIVEKVLLVDSFKKVVKETLKVSDGKVLDWIYLDTPASVVIIGVTTDNKVIMVKQYRYNLKQDVLELPAGGVSAKDQGNIVNAAQREFEEETGYRAEKYQYLGKYYVLPSETNRWVHYVVATKATKFGTPNLDAEIEKYFDMSVDEHNYSDLVETKDSLLCGMETIFGLTLVKDYFLR